MDLSKSQDPLKILMIGTLPPPMVSGTTIGFQQLANELNQHDDVENIVVNTGGIRSHGIKGLIRFVKVVREIIINTGKVDIVTLHINCTALPVIGPVVLAVVQLYRKPFIIRMFGGMGYAQLHGVAKWVAVQVIKRAYKYLVQTKKLVSETIADGFENVEWYPNSRTIPTKVNRKSKNRKCRKFVFLGRVTITKGILEIIEAAERFDNDISVDIYGPFEDMFSEHFFMSLKRINCWGSVPPNQIIEILSHYDALLLPTYHATEGYPGVILEAYAAGIPVISTYWRAIPEVVDESSGLLIEPQNADALFEAMKRLVEDDMLYAQLCKGAQERASAFSSKTMTEHFITLCYQIKNSS